MSKAMKVLSDKMFNYDLFKTDLVTMCKQNGMSIAKVSAQVIYRSESYLSNVIRERIMPVNIAVAIAKWMQVEMKRYEIPIEAKEPDTQKKKKEEKKEELEEKDEVMEKGWSCKIRVDEEFGMAMMKIFKDGKEIALGRSYTYGSDDLGIMQGISYAAHMCYKILQQDRMATEVVKVESEQEENRSSVTAAVVSVDKETENIKADSDDDMTGTGRVVFKDWIRKYEKDNSKAGKLARFVSSHYSKIPSIGKKKIRLYIRMNNGETHLETFESMWSLYVKWSNAQYVMGNASMGMVG